MANLQIAEVLYGAKVFVLHVADEVSFKARALLAVDREVSHELPDSEEPERESFTPEGEELFVGAAGRYDLPKVEPAEAEVEAVPSPSPAELARQIARSMFTPETGVPATDDASDR